MSVETKALVRRSKDKDKAKVKEVQPPPLATLFKLTEYFIPLPFPDIKRADVYHAYRFFASYGMLVSKKDPETPAQLEVKARSLNRIRITALTWGSVYFPYQIRHKVLAKMALEIESQTPIFWNQMAYHDPENGEYMRFALDIDSCARILSYEELLLLTQTAYKTLRSYYTGFKDRPIEVYTAKCGPRIKKGKLTTGTHIYCHVAVTIEQAQQLTYAFWLRLSKLRRFSMDGLTVDPDIYKPLKRLCTMRFIYASKVDDCPMCAGFKKGNESLCGVCHGRRRVSTIHTYEPLLCLHPQTGECDREYFIAQNTNFTRLLSNYSLWAEPTEVRDDFHRPEEDAAVETTDFLVKQQLKAAAAVEAVAATDDPTKPTGTKRSRTASEVNHLKLINDRTLVDQMEEFINSLVVQGRQIWQNTSVDRISMDTDKKRAYVFITGAGSSDCPYAKKDHDGNRLYFTLNSKGSLALCCNSNKPEYRCKTQPKLTFAPPGKLCRQIFGQPAPPDLTPNHISVTEQLAAFHQPFQANQTRRQPSLVDRLNAFTKRRKK